MSETVLATFGITSGVIQLSAQIPYFRDIFRHTTKPERATWWIWSILSTSAFFAQLAAHASWSLYFTGAQLLVSLSIALLSLRYGYGKFHRKDILSLVVVALGLLLWKFTRNPLAALLIVIGVDAIGFWLTLAKTWEAPHTETLLTWSLVSVSALLGVLSVGGLSFTRLVYPFYIMTGNILMVVIITCRRRIIKFDP